jgi:hypothetical protein
MKKLLIIAALCGALIANNANALTLAVFGDWPTAPICLPRRPC